MHVRTYARTYIQTDGGQTFETGFISLTLSKSRPKYAVLLLYLLQCCGMENKRWLFGRVITINGDGGRRL